METKHTDHRSRSPQRGVTLIEMAVAIAVTVIVAATAAPGLTSFIEARRLDAAATQLAADIQLVRTEAVARNLPIRLSIHGDAASSCWVVHTGGAAQCSCAASGPAVCSGDATEIKTVVLGASDRVGVQGNVASMLFDPLHGTTTPTGTLRLVDAHGRAVHHIVNVMGRVRSCTPSGVPGWRAC
jgi:type IV fimbrial biogenesis protein FimT